MAVIKIVASIVVYCVFASCNSQNKIEADKTTQTAKMGYVEFLDSTNIKNIEVLVEVAENDYERAKGLMYREDLPENQGMLFIFNEAKERNFWMKNTPVSLDIIFVDADLKIIKIHKDTTPFSTTNYSSHLPAMYVVEVRAGFSERYQIFEGNKIKLRDI